MKLLDRALGQLERALRQRRARRAKAERERRRAGRRANHPTDQLGLSAEEARPFLEKFKMQKNDTILRECVDCHQEFEITIGERMYFDMKGLVLPKRCKACRALRRAGREAGSAMTAAILLFALLLPALVSAQLNRSYPIRGITVDDFQSNADMLIRAGGNTWISPVGDIVFDPDGNDLYPNVNYDLNLGLINHKFLTLHAAELWVETLVAQNTMATIGGRILVGPTTTLTIDILAAYDAIVVKHNSFASGDVCYLESSGKVEFVSIRFGAVSGVSTFDKQFSLNWGSDRSASYTAGRQFVISGSTGNDGTYTVVSASYSAPNTYVTVSEAIPSPAADGSHAYFLSGSAYEYVVTRDLDSTGANDWYAGDAIFNTGTTGNGFMDLYSVRGVKAASEYGPTIVGNVRTSSTYNAWAPRWAIGNLNGLFGYSGTTYGAAFGNPSGTWLSIDATNGVRGMSSSTNRFWLKADGSGQLANGNISWDTSGVLTASGWKVDSAAFTKDTGTNATSAGMAPTDYPFYAGATYANRATAPFRVTPAGALVASNADINGTLTAGNVTVDSGGVALDAGSSATSVSFSNFASIWGVTSGGWLYLNADNIGFQAGSYTFTGPSTVYANNLDLSGTLDLSDMSALYIDPPSTTAADSPVVYSSGNHTLYYKTGADCSGATSVDSQKGIVTGCSDPVTPQLAAMEARLAALEAREARPVVLNAALQQQSPVTPDPEAILEEAARLLDEAKQALAKAQTINDDAKATLAENLRLRAQLAGCLGRGPANSATPLRAGGQQ